MTDHPTRREPNQTDEIAAAKMLLAKLGITPTDLLADATNALASPTFAEYIPRVAQAVSAGTRRAYSTYWNRIITTWGSRQLTDVTALDITQLAEHIKTTAAQRRNTRGGRSAAEHTISALRCLYKHAVADNILNDTNNPATRVPKPRRLPSTRRALPTNRLDEIHHATATTGNDPALDTLLIRLHVETACRRGGALALTPTDLDPQQCLVQLHEKGETLRWQPVSPTLMTHLVNHGKTRGGLDTEHPLLRYTSGQPISARRYDHLWQRLGRHLPWVATQQVSTHWLRHTTLTWVERNFGYAVAHAFAGHTDSRNDRNATTTYVQATVEEVATALAALTREPHPLASDLTQVSLMDIPIRDRSAPRDNPPDSQHGA
ncbi:site-specific integrase [Kibdelosporangium persicum]|uniref:Site-specific recombinase XerD n=1 Tax=Kibdelosporangium persicum TaxID=2698649 RepID=A0ABX2FIX7_9PSEU|nr:site-specific integrase [Kibdelosporangium persicum]NRN70832.1 Site-specific recombinase XerD [Kibdelosporangium persicum]